MTHSHRLPEPGPNVLRPAVPPYMDELLEVLLEASREALAASDECIIVGRSGLFERTVPPHDSAKCTITSHFSSLGKALAHVATNPIDSRITQRHHDLAVVRHLNPTPSTSQTEGASS